MGRATRGGGAARAGLVGALLAGCVTLPTDAGLDAIEVRVSVTPEQYALSQGPVWLKVRVTATNTTGDYINVRVGGPPFALGGTPTPGSGVGFSVRVDDSTGAPAGPSVDTWGQPVFVFRGGETKAFEDSTLVNNASWPLAAGTYAVIGYFGGQAGPAATLVVTP